jgi:hypothetical protein
MGGIVFDVDRITFLMFLPLLTQRNKYFQGFSLGHAILSALFSQSRKLPLKSIATG